MSLGFFNAGFNVLYAFDNDRPSIDTYKRNMHGTRVDIKDAREVTGSNIASDLGPDDFGFKDCPIRPMGELDVLVGGPPCQGFSSQNIYGEGDVRNQLVEEFLRLVSELRPRMFLLENVPGLVGKRGSSITNRLSEWSEQTNYQVTWRLLNARDFGVAQNRKRIFMVGIIGRKTDLERLEPIFSPPDDVNKELTIRDKIFDLQDDSQNIGIPNQIHANLAPINLERLQYIRPGEGRNVLPERLKLPTQRRHADNGHVETYGRLMWDEAAPTLTTSFHSISKGRFAHPSQDRGLSLREGARLQGFPDHFEFMGPVQQIARQIGNSVAPPIAEALAIGMRKFMDVDLADTEEGKSLAACNTHIQLSILEFNVLNVLYRRINEWVSIPDIEEELHKGINAIRMTLDRILLKFDRSGIAADFLMNKKRGGYYRLRGYKALQWI